MNSRQSFTGRAERLYVFIALLLMIGALRPIYTDRSTELYFDHTSGSFTYQSISGAVYLIAFTILLHQHRQAISLFLKNKCLIVFVLLAVLSASWAIAQARGAALGSDPALAHPGRRGGDRRARHRARCSPGAHA